MTKELKEKIFEMRRKGMGYKTIAEELNISPNTIRSFLQRYKDVDFSFCLECGTGFVFPIKRKRKKFCSDACRMTWWTKHPEERKPKAIYNYVCPVCGKAFIAKSVFTRHKGARRESFDVVGSSPENRKSETATKIPLILVEKY